MHSFNHIVYYKGQQVPDVPPITQEQFNDLRRDVYGDPFTGNLMIDAFKVRRPPNPLKDLADLQSRIRKLLECRAKIADIDSFDSIPDYEGA